MAGVGPGPGDAVSTYVNFSPWCTDAACTTFASLPIHNATQDTYYATIQAAVDAASAGDSIEIAAGTYVENVTITQSVTLAGAGEGSTTVMPAVSNANPCTGSSLCGGAASNVFLVQANDVTIHDLSVDGDNPALTSGIVRGGADLDARNGIIKNTDATYNNLEVFNVTVKNIYLRGIYSTGGTFNFHDNTVTNVQGDGYSIAIFAWGGPGTIENNTVSYANDAISANHSSGIQFLDNTITYSGSGVHTDNSGDSSGAVADLIQGNHVDCTGVSGAYGIWVFVPYVAPTVNNNTVTGCNVGLSAWGQGAAVTTQFTNNTVNGVGGGAGSVGAYITTDLISWGYSDISVVFTGNVITGFDTGLYLAGEAQSWNPVAWTDQTITATFHLNQIYDNTTPADKGATGTYAADLESNWWGSAAGPSGILGMDYDPWCTDAACTQLSDMPISQWASGATASSQYSSTSWGAIQATGAPDTNSCGDRSTAWSPRTSQSSAEWLKATYDQTVYATGLRVHETYQAGFITGIDLLEPDGTVHALSITPDSTPCTGYYELTFAETPYLVNGIVVHTAKPGYEEIDAVELTGVVGTYVPPEYNLTINQVGNGTVTTDLAAPYHAGDVVHLTAVPDSGWVFSDWSGDVTGTTSEIDVTMNGNKTVTATFIEQSAAPVSQWASGATASSQYSSTSWGAIQATGAPDTNSCGDRSTAWSPRTSQSSAEWLKATYDQTVYATGLRVHETYQAGFITGIDLLEPDGTVHALSITPDSTPCTGYYELTFAETPYLVNGIVVHTAKPGYEEIDAVELTGVVGTYVPPEYNLTINQVGNGTVTTDLAAPYHAGDVVHLTAVPDSGWVFSDWSGDVTGTTSEIDVTMNGNKTVTATFIEQSAAPVSQWASGATASSQYSSTSWGAIQATGAPDTNSCGDRSTAWSPRTSQSSAEWLKATYDQTVYATGLRVHETYQAGFITGIDLLEPDGTVHALSITPDSTPCTGYYELTFAETPYLVNGIVVHTAKPGYEEIDAVELTGVPAP